MNADKNNDKPGRKNRSLFAALTDIRHPVHRLAILVIVLSLLLADCTGLFFRPTRQFIDDPLVTSYTPQDVYFKSPDGLLLHGWYFRARNEKGTILVCHGNVENVSTHAKLDLWLVDAGYNVFIFDYRGYGRSQGVADVKGVHLDAEAALETVLFSVPREIQDAIIVSGKSLGGAIAVYTIAHSRYKDRVKALVLDSVFSSYRRIAREKVADSIVGWPFQYPLSYLVNDDYSPERFIAQVAPIPIEIVHGSEDRIVPIHHGRMLYDAATAPKQFREIALPGHVLAQADAMTREQLLAFFGSLPEDSRERANAGIKRP